MINRDQILSLIPHQGAMCLWDHVLQWDPGHIHLRTATHRSPGNPLRTANRLHAIHLCEYGAQAMAIHGGLIARAAAPTTAPAPGMLVSLRGITLHTARIDHLPTDLHCTAHPLAQTSTSQQYSFSITHAGTLLAEGRAAVILSPG